MNILILTLLGFCFGSFVNALVWRLHEQSTAKSKKQKAKYSVSRGRSMCPNCKHSLAWYDLLPVISWITLKGKCRYCNQPISWQYPIIELATAFLFIFSYIYWPSSRMSSGSIELSSQSSIMFVFWLVFLVGFIALAVYDLRWMILPDRIVRPLQALAVIYVLIQAIVFHGSWPTLQGALLGLVFSAGLFYMLYQISHGTWIGGGDVKLAVVLGLLLGSLSQSFLMIFIASFIGSLITIPLLLLGRAKQNTRLPFGPLLIVATIIVYLFGESLLAWYEYHFLIV